MATLTIRNVRPAIVKSLKSQAKRNGRSMEQEVRELLEQRFADRLAVLEEIKRMVASQSRRPTHEEIDSWIEYGRE